MTGKTKRTLKKISKGALFTLLTAGGYLLAKGAMQVILNHLEPKGQKDRDGNKA